MFADGPGLTLWLNGRRVNGLSADVVAQRDSDVILRKRFRVFERGVLVCDYRYLSIDHEDVPDVDIFSWLARSLSGDEARARTWLIFSDQLSGAFAPTEEYLRQLPSRVAVLLSRDRGT
ncbi:MAG: hypothetical protein NVS4B10_05990 [Myxococcales bacterium]